MEVELYANKFRCPYKVLKLFKNYFWRVRGTQQGGAAPCPRTCARCSFLVASSPWSVLPYPIYFQPLMQLETYQKEQAVNRAGIVQEHVQPPRLKVWSNIFGRKWAYHQFWLWSRHLHVFDSAASTINHLAIEGWPEKNTTVMP